uniref:fructokinase n=3 Tax=Oryza TaxID=4527 RepID=A0A0E0PVH4_ORYRU
MALHAAPPPPPPFTAGRLPTTSRRPCFSAGRIFRCSLPAAAARPRNAAFLAPLRTSSAVCTKAVSNSDGTPGTSSSPHVVCFGELLIDFVPTVNGVSLAEASAFKKAPGGAPANVAVGIARLGGSSAFIGKVFQPSSFSFKIKRLFFHYTLFNIQHMQVGDDEFGYMLADILKENNVNNQGLLFDAHARTALAFVTLRNDGEREFMFYRNPSADMLLEEKELDLDLIRKAKIFHHGSISLITEPCKTAHIAAAKAAKDAGVLISYDPNLRLPLWSSADDARDGILSIWETADVIKISEEEVSFLTKGEDPYDDSVIKKLMHPNLKLLLVTEGPEGCRYYSKEFNGRVGGLKVNAVDTTGAGDAFVAGILSQLSVDFSLLQDEGRLKEALKFANVCGALTVTERGAIPALPTRQQVVDALTKVVA